MTRLLLPGAVFFVALAGCGLLAGLGDYSPGRPDEAGDSTADGGGDSSSPEVHPFPKCGDGSQCVPRPPDAWSGPLTVAIGSPDADCPAGYTGKTEVTLYGDPEHGICSCSCGPPSGAACSAPTLEVYSTSSCNTCGFADAACGQVILSSCEMPTCSTSGGIVAIGSYAIVSPSLPEGGRCEPGVADAGAMHGSAATICSLASVSMSTHCGDTKLCVDVPPSPFRTSVACIQRGEGDCPAAFPAPYGYYAEGGAPCTKGTCGCDVPTGGGPCGLGVAWYEGLSCTTTPTYGDGGCAPAPNAAGFLVTPDSGPTLPADLSCGHMGSTARSGDPDLVRVCCTSKLF